MTLYRNRHTPIDLQDEEDRPALLLSTPPLSEEPSLNASLGVVKEESTLLSGPYPATRVLQKHDELAARTGRRDRPIIDDLWEGAQVLQGGVKAFLQHIGHTGRQILGTIIGGIIVLLFLNIGKDSTAGRGHQTQVR